MIVSEHMQQMQKCGFEVYLRLQTLLHVLVRGLARGEGSDHLADARLDARIGEMNKVHCLIRLDVFSAATAQGWRPQPGLWWS